MACRSYGRGMPPCGPRPPCSPVTQTRPNESGEAGTPPGDNPIATAIVERAAAIAARNHDRLAPIAIIFG